MNGPTGDERDDVSEAVARVDDESRILFGVVQLVLIAAKIGGMRSGKRTKHIFPKS
jgi:hypothetical protein